MPRQARTAPGGLVYHVLNRSGGRVKLFRTDKDYLAFQDLLVEAHQRTPIRLLSYCVLPEYWQLVVWPKVDGELLAFFRWLTHTHAVRWHASHPAAGGGHVYQGRYRNFPVQRNESLLTVCRYVEGSARTAGLASRAEQWPWSSLWAWEHGPEDLQAILPDWPVERPRDWTRRVNLPLPAEEAAKIQISLARCRPFGDDAWVRTTVSRLHLEHTVRPQGRPKKQVK